MEFSGFYGNKQLKKNLSAAFDRDHPAHFYLISGPEGSGKKTLARILSAALLCRSEDKPCGVCNQCRKAMSGNHPDLITVDDKDHQTIPVKVVREAAGDLFIRPNEGAKKIYYVPRGQDLGIPSQNALLKVLEEPPHYGVFLILTNNPHKLLPTVRSRCVELKMQPLDRKTMESCLSERFPDADRDAVKGAIHRSGGWLGQAQALLQSGEGWLPQTREFAAAYLKKDAMALLQLTVSMEKMKRDQLIPILQQWQELLSSALLYRNGLPPLDSFARSLGEARTSMELSNACDALSLGIQRLQGNISPGAVCGALVWQLR